MTPAPAGELLPHTPAIQVAVLPGDIYCAKDPTLLTTVLGSCVAVCLWDVRRRIGGMNHFVLPTGPQGEQSTRYGDVAIDTLVERVHRAGSRTADLRAKIFGGAAVLPFAGATTIGTSNVQLAIERLANHRISVVARRTGGTLGQQIRFNSATGEVLFRWLARTA